MKKENSEVKIIQERVLVVDDETQVTKYLAEVFTRAGLDVRIANNGYDALKIAESESCSVAIVDLKMPGLSGIETIRLLRKQTLIWRRLSLPDTLPLNRLLTP